MKKLFLVAIAGLLFTISTNAQVQREMPQHQHMKSDSSHHFQKGKMMEQLNLTTDQKTQMKTLRENMQQQRNAIQNDASLTADQKKEKMKALHKDQMGKVNAILTPDQQAKMKVFRQQRMQNRKMHNKQNKMNQPQQS